MSLPSSSLATGTVSPAGVRWLLRATYFSRDLQLYRLLHLPLTHFIGANLCRRAAGPKLPLWPKLKCGNFRASSLVSLMRAQQCVPEWLLRY